MSRTPEEQLIAPARRGLFLEVLPGLVELARSGQSAGAAESDWEAAAAAIRILFWRDRFTEAADLAEELITRTAPAGGELCDQDVPFGEAFLAAQIHERVPAAPRLLAAAARVPAGRILQEELGWTAEALETRQPVDLLPNVSDWGGEVKPLEGVGRALAARDYTLLTPREQRLVWQELQAANDFPRAHELSHSSVGDPHYPPQHAGCVWMAGWYAVERDVPNGECLLLAAHGRWWPCATWDPLPDAMVLHPVLRGVCTERVRDYYLTRPIGPEAEKATQR